MKWTNKNHEFDTLASIICQDGYEYYIWGAGVMGQEIYNVLKHRISIVGFIDKDKQKQAEGIEGLPVYPFESIDFNNKKARYLVSQLFYPEMSKKLKEKQLKENEDFFNFLTFARLYFLYKYNEVLIYRTDISITEKCTLKCKKCNMFMPYFTSPENQDINMLKEDVDAFFKAVDYVIEFKVLGGEPILYPQLKEFLEYLTRNYSGRIGNVEIFTNATLRLSDELLKLIKRENIIVGITDYSNTVAYEKRVNEFRDDLERYNIRYKYDKPDTWVDFGFPDEPYNLVGEDRLIRHFDACNFVGRGLYNKRFYFCHMFTSATRCGLFEDSDEDYIDLEQMKDKVELIEFEMGYCKKGYHDFCKVCRGCRSTIVIPAGEQKGI